MPFRKMMLPEFCLAPVNLDPLIFYPTRPTSTIIFSRQLKRLTHYHKNEQPRTASLCRGWAMLENDFNLICMWRVNRL